MKFRLIPSLALAAALLVGGAAFGAEPSETAKGTNAEKKSAAPPRQSPPTTPVEPASETAAPPPKSADPTAPAPAEKSAPKTTPAGPASADTVQEMKREFADQSNDLIARRKALIERLNAAGNDEEKQRIVAEIRQQQQERLEQQREIARQLREQMQHKRGEVRPASPGR